MQAVRQFFALFSYLLFHIVFSGQLLGQTPASPASYVNPHTGTDGGGETFPGAVVPWGMVSVSPHVQQNSSGPSGFAGFGHVHISGAGCDGLGHIVLMPGVGRVRTNPAAYGYRYESWNTLAQAGFFKMYLSAIPMMVDITVSERASISRFMFPRRDGDATILFDVSAGYSRPIRSFVEFVSPTEIRGWHTSEGLCDDASRRTVYFYAYIGTQPSGYATWSGGVVNPQATRSAGNNVGAYVQFTTKENDSILVKVGISYVSMENARLNVDTEIPHWDFEQVRQQATARWNEELGKIAVSGNEETKRTFYTALYHSLLHPNVYSDVNGQYPSMLGYNTLQADGYTRYTVYSLWDTYRTVHPLLALVYPERQADMARTLTEQYRESGWLAQWELPGGESNAMFGDPAGLVLLDSYTKGLPIDLPTAAEAAVRNATIVEGNTVRRGLSSYIHYGYIPMDDRGTPRAPAPVSSALEFAQSDWAASELALLQCNTTGQQLRARSHKYSLLFDRSTGFFRPRNTDGSWYRPFEPTSEENGDFPGSGGAGFAEGHAWHYLFAPVHDISGLTTLLGGRDSAIHRLEQFFEREYFRWNEHNLAYPYLFTSFDNEGWRTQQLVRTLATAFNASQKGIPGNDDAGALSAWYVLTAIGLYPVQPGVPEYRIGSPLFDTVAIALNSVFYPGKQFKIVARNNAPDCVYADSTRLNGSPYHWYSISHSAITNGGELLFHMAPTPAIAQYEATPIPRIIGAWQDTLFADSTAVLRWQPCREARSIRLVIHSPADNCAAIVDTLLGGTDSTFVFQPPYPGTLYSWNAQASYSAFESGWSERHQIFIDYVKTPPTTSAALTQQPALLLKSGPNPLHTPPLVIQYQMESSGTVHLAVVDILGRRTALYSGHQSAGTHSQQWYPHTGASGVFFVEIKVDDKVLWNKVVIRL